MLALRAYCSVLLWLVSLAVMAQAGTRLPVATHALDWHLGVSDVHTTTLIFPHDVISVDRGTGDVLTQTLDAVTNIVKVKATGEGMEASSLTVITSGGMVYTFRVSYERNPATLTYRLEPIRAANLEQPAAYPPTTKSNLPLKYVPPADDNRTEIGLGLPTVTSLDSPREILGERSIRLPE